MAQLAHPAIAGWRVEAEAVRVTNVELTSVAAEVSPSPAEVEAALASLLSASGLANAPRLASLLSFLVRETLAGRASQIKAYTIATMVFGCSEDFDPQANSLVRVEAMRLRKALDRYYGGPGLKDVLMIQLSPGSYVPSFVVRKPLEPDEFIAPAGMVSPVRPGRSRAFLLSGAALLLCGVATAGVIEWRGREWPAAQALSTETLAPQRVAMAGQSRIQVSVTQPGGSGDASIFAEILRHSIEMALSRFDNPVVVTDGAADYALEGRLIPVGADRHTLFLRLWNRSSGEVLWSRSYADLRPGTGGTEGAVDNIVGTIARTHGVIFADMRRKLMESKRRPERFDCVILGENYLNDPVAERWPVAKNCLERAIAEDPGFSAGYATLALMLTNAWLNGDTFDGDSPIMERAQRLAYRAVEEDRQSSRAFKARSTVNFHAGRFEDAFRDGRRAIEINFNGIDATGRLGRAYVLRGNFDEGMSLLRRVQEISSSSRSSIDFCFFLEAFLADDFARAETFAMRESATVFPLGMMSRIIALLHRGDRDGAARWVSRLRSVYPAIAADVGGALDRFQIAPVIKARLLAALADAHLPPRT